MLDPPRGGALPPDGNSQPPGPGGPGPDLRPRGLWIAFVVLALGVPLVGWILRSC